MLIARPVSQKTQEKYICSLFYMPYIQSRVYFLAYLHLHALLPHPLENFNVCSKYELRRPSALCSLEKHSRQNPSTDLSGVIISKVEVVP
jgi:hypothetical protein